MTRRCPRTLCRPAPGTPKPSGVRNDNTISIVAEVGRTNSASNDRDEMEARLAGLSRASLLSIQRSSQKSSPSDNKRPSPGKEDKWSPQSQEASTASTTERVPLSEGRRAAPPPPLLDDRHYTDPWRIDYAGMFRVFPISNAPRCISAPPTPRRPAQPAPRCPITTDRFVGRSQPQDRSLSRHSKCNRNAPSNKWHYRMPLMAHAHTCPDSTLRVT